MGLTVAQAAEVLGVAADCQDENELKLAYRCVAARAAECKS